MGRWCVPADCTQECAFTASTPHGISGASVTMELHQIPILFYAHYDLRRCVQHRCQYKWHDIGKLASLNLAEVEGGGVVFAASTSLCRVQRCDLSGWRSMEAILQKATS